MGHDCSKDFPMNNSDCSYKLLAAKFSVGILARTPKYDLHSTLVDTGRISIIHYDVTNKNFKAIPYDAHKTFFWFYFFCSQEHFFGDKFALTL